MGSWARWASADKVVLTKIGGGDARCKKQDARSKMQEARCKMQDAIQGDRSVTEKQALVIAKVVLMRLTLLTEPSCSGYVVRSDVW